MTGANGKGNTMSTRNRTTYLVLAAAAAAALASGPLAAPASAAVPASGYPTYEACDEAGQDGVAAGFWEEYTCTPYQGRWRLNPR